MNEHFVLILNPASGSVTDAFRPAIEKALDQCGANYEVRETTPEVSGEALAAAAVQAGVTRLVACGGDGTVMSVVNGIGKVAEAGGGGPSGGGPSGSGVTLAIIPGGTANLLAAALDIPADIDEAVAVLMTGEDQAIDLGRCGDQLFALGLGLGLTERLVSQVSSEQKEKLGKLAYALAMLREMGARPSVFTFKLDNQRSRRARGVAIVVANAGEIGGGFKFAPRAAMDDGRLDLCILHRFYFRDFVRMLWRALRGQLPADRAVSFFQAQRIEIRTVPPLDLQIDGEPVEQRPPFVAEVLPQALRVRVPRRKDEG